jgi:hypothetical protein
MSSQRGSGRISVRPAKETGGGPAPPARPKAPQGPQSYSGYLDDHPVLVPALVLVLGGLFLYCALFTHVLRDLMMGPNPLGTALGNYNEVMAWSVAAVAGFMFLSLCFLIIHGISMGWRRVRRQPAVCKRCGLAEKAAPVRFKRAPVQGTAWEQITCSKCGADWYGRL